MTEQTTEVTRPKASALTDPANAAFTANVRQAQALAESDLVPQAYRGNVANVMVAAELAQRIGASVMAVMQNLHVIQGKPSFSSSFLIACVNSCGRFSPLKFRFEGDGDNYGCRAVAVELKTGEECVGPLVTRAMAKAEGWSTKTGSKWKTMEELMFSYRAAAFWTRLYAPELTLGMHTTDEVEDFTPVTVLQRVPTANRPTRPRALEAIAGNQARADGLDAAIGEDEAPAATGTDSEQVF